MADVFHEGQERQGPRESGPVLSLEDGAWLACAAYKGRERERLLSEEAARDETANGPDPSVAQTRFRTGESETPELLRLGEPLVARDGADRLGAGGWIRYWPALRLILRAYGAAVALTAAIGLLLLWLTR
jgi:hypothetical protein